MTEPMPSPSADPVEKAALQKRYTGKTKDIYTLPNGHLRIIFKDDVTGENGVVDPGSNTVMGQIAGKGRMSLALTRYFYTRIAAEGIPTHLVAVDLDRGFMDARAARMPGADRVNHGGLEFVCRKLAYGSFLRRYRKLVGTDLQDLNYLVEITLKDDDRGDPLINDDTLVTLGLLTADQLAEAKRMTRHIARLIADDLQTRALSLIDIKMEFGLIDNAVALVDEISGDCMRVMDKDGRILAHDELTRRVLSA